MSPILHLAQVNIAHANAPLDDPVMAGFVARLDEINALADESPGFVWRLQGDEGGNATYLRPFEDANIIVNMSVWETIEHLQQYVYRSAHTELIRQRQAWFKKSAGVYAALWWVPIGHHPRVDEAKMRLEHLEQHGPTPFAFTFQKRFTADAAFVERVD
jgi:hypothetical protein